MKIGKQFRASSKSVIKDDAAAAKPLSSGDKTADKLQVTALSEQIGALQDMLYAGHEHKILVVLQGMDTSGKDGAVSGVFANVNPQGIRIAMGGVSVTLERARKASFSASHMVDGKAAIARCADVAKFQSLEMIDRPATRAIVNPGGTNERFARTHYKQAQLLMHPDNVTIFQQIIDGKADIMVTDASETLWQAKQHPQLCSINPDRPLQFSEKAFMLPRGDVAFKEYVDIWMHLLKATGGYEQIFNHWLK